MTEDEKKHCETEYNRLVAMYGHHYIQVKALQAELLDLEAKIMAIVNKVSEDKKKEGEGNK
jgi:hypothetical protein